MSAAPRHAAVAWLRDALVARRLQPGEPVAHDDVAAQLGVPVAPVHEALGMLEREGQLAYVPGGGYFAVELRIEDAEELFELRAVLEEQAARDALPALDEPALERMALAARDCVNAADTGEVAAQLAADRRFHFALFEACRRPHRLRLIRLVWNAVEPYLALAYDVPQERTAAIHAHDRISASVRRGDGEALVAELAGHRRRVLEQLRGMLTP